MSHHHRFSLDRFRPALGRPLSHKEVVGVILAVLPLAIFIIPRLNYHSILIRCVSNETTDFY